MYSPDRQQVRQFFIDLWQRRISPPTEGLAALALPLMEAQPEYHPLLERPPAALEREYPPELGETNPFLHLSLHLALAEQLGVDQPAGVRASYARLLMQHQDAHKAQHAMIDCLAEMIWQAQRNATAYDPAVYQDCLQRQIL